jgi:TRAP-type uncharacterized transport system fused permease subunit
MGVGLLLKVPPGGSWVDIILITVKSALGLAALAAAAQNWTLRRNTLVEGVLLAVSGLLLIFPSLMEALAEAITGRDVEYTATAGLVIGGAVVLWQAMRLAALAPAAPR